MGEDSRLLILSNEGIMDEDPEEGIESIRKKAISLRTQVNWIISFHIVMYLFQIHSIVLSPRVPNKNNIYFGGGFQILRELSESTLGFFITPFDASGGQILGKDGISKVSVWAIMNW